MKEYQPPKAEVAALSQADLQVFMDERRRLVWLICMTIRPGVHIFASRLEYELYPPETEENDSFELLEVPWEDMMWTVIGAPVRDLVRIKATAHACGLRIADGVPMMFSSHRGKERINYFPMNSRRCFTMESESDLINPPLIPHQQHRLIEAEKKLCERVWKGWKPTDKVLRETIEAVYRNVRGGHRAC